MNLDIELSELPLLTYYDDATGERTELSGSALAGWASRVAGLLHEGCGLGAGDRAAILLYPHWQTAAVLLGAWGAGLSVSFRLSATAGLGADPEEPYEAAFVARDRVDSWLDPVPEATHRFVLGGTLGGPAPDGYRDLMAELDGYTDRLPGYAPVRRTDWASADGTTFREWGSLAGELAGTMDLRRGDRVLIDAAQHEHPLKWLLAPLAVGASVVLCAHLDPTTLDAKRSAEGVTRVL